MSILLLLLATVSVKWHWMSFTLWIWFRTDSNATMLECPNTNTTLLQHQCYNACMHHSSDLPILQYYHTMLAHLNAPICYNATVLHCYATVSHCNAMMRCYEAWMVTRLTAVMLLHWNGDRWVLNVVEGKRSRPFNVINFWEMLQSLVPICVPQYKFRKEHFYSMIHQGLLFVFFNNGQWVDQWRGHL